MLVETRSWDTNPELINQVFSGRTITRVAGLELGETELFIYFNEDEYIKMYHSQDCCENVDLDDICGNTDLEGATFYELVEKKSNVEMEAKSEYDDSWTWTFYTIKTSKGYLDLRWYGSSNGYYSEGVDLEICYEDTYDVNN